MVDYILYLQYISIAFDNDIVGNLVDIAEDLSNLEVLYVILQTVPKYLTNDYYSDMASNLLQGDISSLATLKKLTHLYVFKE